MQNQGARAGLPGFSESRCHLHSRPVANTWLPNLRREKETKQKQRVSLTGVWEPVLAVQALSPLTPCKQEAFPFELFTQVRMEPWAALALCCHKVGAWGWVEVKTEAGQV